MEQIKLTSYGFIRTPENDFSDDGNHFKCYTYKGIRVSYLKYKGEVYISGSASGIGLNYEEYSSLPHYRALDKLNGVDESEVTPESIEQLKKDIEAFMEEVNNFEVKEVSDQEIVEYFEQVKAKKEMDFNKAMALLNDVPVENIFNNLSKYELQSIKDYIQSERKAISRWSKEEALKTSQQYRRQLLKSQHDLKSAFSWFVGEIIKLANKALED